LATVQRGSRIIVPKADDRFEDGDELLFVADESVDGDIRDLIHGGG
jgi:trk system potassium uptake protein TrkA